MEVETSISGTTLCLCLCLLWLVNVPSGRADLPSLSVEILSPFNWIDDSRWARGKQQKEKKKKTLDLSDKELIFLLNLTNDYNNKHDRGQKQKVDPRLSV